MPSNEGHIHWVAGTLDDDVTYLGQPLIISNDDTNGDPIGSLRIRHADHTGEGLLLPNSSAADPRWDDVPGTNPVLQVRQDGHYPSWLIRIRQA